MRQLGYAVQNLYGAVYSNLQGQPLHGAAAIAGKYVLQNYLLVMGKGAQR
jgi:hypothetical protein